MKISLQFTCIFKQQSCAFPLTPHIPSTDLEWESKMNEPIHVSPTNIVFPPKHTKHPSESVSARRTAAFSGNALKSA